MMASGTGLSQNLALTRPMASLQRGGGSHGMFWSSDEHALSKQVEETHVPGAIAIDVRPLFNVVEDILTRSIYASTLQPLPVSGGNEMEQIRALGDFMETVPDLPLTIGKVSAQTRSSAALNGTDLHAATLQVLTVLRNYSWEAKVVLSVAAFALHYGEFWLLAQMYPTNQLAKSMALLKHRPSVVEHPATLIPKFEGINTFIKAILNVTRCIVEFRELPSNYISEDDPEVKAAVAYFPVAVYWTIRSSIGAVIVITQLTNVGQEYRASPMEAMQLSEWTYKLNSICGHLRKTLDNLNKMIGEKREIDAQNMLRDIIYNMIHIDNMKVLKALIYAKDDIPALYDGTSKRRVYLDVLRRKNVLLLISDLDIAQEELSILEHIYSESRIHAYEIIWMPIVDHSIQWTDQMQTQFETLQGAMPWYSVHHPSIIDNAVVRFLRKEWHFRSQPILVVLDPQGKVLSPNAIHMMWIWGSNAFPFTSTREATLWREESWRVELLVNVIDPTILEWIREEKYIFLYGGADLQWIRSFTTEARLVAQQARIPLEMVYVGNSHHREKVRKICVSILLEKLSYCWQDPSSVWFFWTRLQSMLHSKIQMEKADDHSDIIIQEIKKLLSYDKGVGGWALLAKGSVIAVNGHGPTALTTLKEYEMWKEQASNEGFEVGYRQHYRQLHMKEYPCSRFDFTIKGRIPQSLLCPECHTAMNKHTAFICCHEGLPGQGQAAPVIADYED